MRNRNISPVVMKGNLGCAGRCAGSFYHVMIQKHNHQTTNCGCKSLPRTPGQEHTPGITTHTRMAKHHCNDGSMPARMAAVSLSRTDLLSSQPLRHGLRTAGDGVQHPPGQRPTHQPIQARKQPTNQPTNHMRRNEKKQVTDLSLALCRVSIWHRQLVKNTEVVTKHVQHEKGV